MKIAVSASGKDLESLVDPLFGRCPYFIIADPDDMSFEAFENPNVRADDAGIKSAQFVAIKGAKVVITGNCGPKAVQELTQTGIEIILGLMGTVRQVLESYKTGSLLATAKPNVEEHFGKHYENTIERNTSQNQNDKDKFSKSTPWFGYVRLNLK